MSKFTGPEMRREARETLFQDEFPGYLVPNDDEDAQIKVRPLDVSPRGLGFFVNQQLKSGDFFWLVIKNHRIRVELAYCAPHMGIDNLYRCGLFIREAEGDLTTICRNLGLIKE